MEGLDQIQISGLVAHRRTSAHVEVAALASSSISTPTSVRDTRVDSPVLLYRMAAERDDQTDCNTGEYARGGNQSDQKSKHACVETVHEDQHHRLEAIDESCTSVPASHRVVQSEASQEGCGGNSHQITML